MRVMHIGAVACSGFVDEARPLWISGCSPGRCLLLGRLLARCKSVERPAERHHHVSLMRGNVGDPRRTNSVRPLSQQGFHGVPVGTGADLRAEIKRWRTENRLAPCADVVPVEGRVEAYVPYVKRLAGVDHGDAAARAIAERSQHRTIHVRDLNALDPCRPLRHERVVESFSAPRAAALLRPRPRRSPSGQGRSCRGRTHLLQANRTGTAQADLSRGDCSIADVSCFSVSRASVAVASSIDGHLARRHGNFDAAPFHSRTLAQATPPSRRVVDGKIS